MNEFLLNNFNDEDLPEILKMLSDRENARLRMAIQIPSNLQDCKNWIGWYKKKELESQHLFAIRFINNYKLIGFCTAKPTMQELNGFEIGIQINEKKQHGLGFKVILELEEYLMIKYSINYFCANIRHDNFPAQKLFTKLGYLYDKTYLYKNTLTNYYVKII